MKEDKVNHPKHYTWLKKLCGIEVIDITRHMCFNLGNVVKYVLRAGHKSEEGYSDEEKELEDLRKARWYLDDEIALRSKTKVTDAEIIKALQEENEKLTEKLQELKEEKSSSKINVECFCIGKSELQKAIEILNSRPNACDEILLTKANGGIGPQIKIEFDSDNKWVKEDITDYDLW